MSFFADENISEHCLTCLTNQGDLSVFSLPNLTRLLKEDCIRREDIQYARLAVDFIRLLFELFFIVAFQR